MRKALKVVATLVNDKGLLSINTDEPLMADVICCPIHGKAPQKLRDHIGSWGKERYCVACYKKWFSSLGLGGPA